MLQKTWIRSLSVLNCRPGRRALAVALFGILHAASAVWAHESDREYSVPTEQRPKQIEGVGITENLGTPLDLDLLLTNEQGQKVPLRSFYDGVKPVAISLVYYSCPGLCNFHLNGVVETLKDMDWSAGEKFQVLAVSFDPKETADLATKKKASYMKVYGRPSGPAGFHFLTADAATIEKLTRQIGFKYHWDTKSGEWAHASAAVVTTPQGVISRYLHGIMFDAKTFRFALSEATQGRIGSFVDQVIWYCFHYDPSQSKYTIYASRVMKVAGGLMILILAFWLIPFLVRARRSLKSAS